MPKAIIHKRGLCFLLIGIFLFVSIFSFMSAPRTAEAKGGFLSAVLIVAAIVFAPYIASTIGGLTIEASTAFSMAEAGFDGFISAVVTGEGGLVLGSGLGYAGAAAAAETAAAVATTFYLNTAAITGLIQGVAFGAGVASQAISSANGADLDVPTPVDISCTTGGCPCYGPTNSCSSAYRGTYDTNGVCSVTTAPPETQCVDGSVCYGPQNSCNQAYQGTRNASGPLGSPNTDDNGATRYFVPDDSESGGRWMSQDEYNQYVASITFVCNAPNYAPPDSGCPAPTCRDRDANNFGGALPCTYTGVVCPPGTVGTYPSCVPTTDTPTICPTGFTGTYPDCIGLSSCPTGYTGTYPNCVAPSSCPLNYTGRYPNCIAPSSCPTGYTGTYPNCVAPSSCPLNYTGRYPNCIAPAVCP